MNLRWVGALAGLAAALALAVAIGAERFAGMIPCALCYVERWPYRVALGLGVVAMLVPSRVLGWVLVAVFLAGGAVAFVHVGVEQRWWPSPLPQCTAPDLRGLSGAARLARMPDRPAKACEDADYPVAGVPVTFAQANLIYALAVGGGLAMLLVRQARRPA